MAFVNPINLFKRIFSPPPVIPADSIIQTKELSRAEAMNLLQFGATIGDLAKTIADNTLVNYERMSLYKETEAALSYSLVNAAVELYADFATNYSQLHNATVWASSEDNKYRSEIEKLFNRIGIEERIFDWAYNTGAYGDLFLGVEASPTLGITAIDDNSHPVNISRLDINGRLIGFYDSPMGEFVGEKTLLAPWKYIHLRLLAAKRKRALYGDPQYTEFRTVSLLSSDTRKSVSSYGTSLCTNAIPIYKRLRLAEDSLLIARLSRGVVRYLYKVKVSGTNVVGINQVLNGYETALKRSKVMETAQNRLAKFEDKYTPPAVAEDVILPVWDNVNDVVVEKLGGDADIHWITDVEAMRNELACALRVPLQLLGGFSGEMPAFFSKGAADRIDIRFARSARRLQRSLLEGLTRLCQIHFAYMGMDPDLRLFKLHMAETSTAEEEELKESLKTGVDIVSTMYDTVIKFTGEEIDKVSLLNYLNRTILKLNDFDINMFVRKVGSSPDITSDQKKNEVKEVINAVLEERALEKRYADERIYNLDLKAYLPEKEFVDKKLVMNEEWSDRYGKQTVKIMEESVYGR